MFGIDVNFEKKIEEICEKLLVLNKVAGLEPKDRQIVGKDNCDTGLHIHVYLNITLIVQICVFCTKLHAMIG